MSKYLKSLRKLPCLVLLLSFTAEAQFDSIIFARNDIYAPKAVIYMGIRMMTVMMILYSSIILLSGVMMQKL